MDAPREPQELVLPESRLDRFREWATEGTATTAAARVRDPEGRVAFVRNRWSDGWVLPGGAVEPGESSAAAARREVREETGLDPVLGDALVVLDQTYVSAATGETAFTAEYVVYDAHARGGIPNGDALGVDAGEIRAARWFDRVPDAFADDALRPYIEA
ncbi:NUDIX domain-containing protein [Salarchaeum japonicum]|uniref:Nudix hydrolase domain-containing protein n=1 Tax=Salarchaeum japonicum TaxID=555573 RepID=A0AAV3SZ09_9EURY|nr:NUDIX hydrolase [Salarchaeum japonicum]